MRQLPPIVLVGLILVILGVILPTAYCQNTKWPGSPCSVDNDCKTPGERDTYMICNNNKCVCGNKQQHFHYGTLNRCYVSALERCEDNYDLTPHSTCESRITTCLANYPVTATKTCAKTDGEQCTTTEECDQDLFLQCLGTTDKNCACPPDSTFVADQGCQLDPQTTCAVKDPDVPGPPVIGCPDHLDCVDKPVEEGVTNLICACAEGLVENGGTCVAPYGAQCLPGDDSKKPCDDRAYLECFTEGTNSTCKCKNSAETVYDANEKICKIQADKGCTADAGQQPCVAFSKCEDVSGETKCKCEDGLSALNGKCVLDYGKGCEAGDDKQPCNTDAYQECDGTNCVCSRKDNTWYDGVECLLLESAACVNDPKNQQCIPFAHCTGEAGKGGDCACAEGLDVSNERFCTTPNEGECGADKAPCGDFQECNPTGDGTISICECTDLANMKYDDVNKACVLKLHSPCVKGDDSRPQCEQFSECNEDANECRCAEGLVEAKDGTCKLSYDEDCSAANAPACNDDVFLECSVDSGKCVCKDSENAQFNATTATCELLPGVPCVEGAGNQPCTEMTECKENGGSFKCACDEGLIESDKKCLMAYGGDCDDGKPDLPSCNTASYEFCDTNKHCACAEDLSSWRENITNKCVLYEGKKCEDTEDAQACVSFAECKQADGATDLTCVCVDQFTRSVEGTCVGLYDAPCGPANDAQCSADNFLECAAEANKCACTDSTSSFYDGKQCVLKVEADCFNDPTSQSQRCSEFSTCNGAPGEAGKCACEGDLEVSDEKTCITPYGGPCGDDKAKCGKFQECSKDSSTCLCEDPDNMIFDATHKKCVLKLNAGCTLNDPTSPECAEFSECQGQDPDAVCKCRLDLVETKDGACALSYDGICSKTDGPKCNDDAYLECNDNQKCACQNVDNSQFNATSKTCELLPGVPCVEGAGNQPCIAMTECKDKDGKGFKCACDEGLIESDKKCLTSYGGDCDDSNPDLPTCNTASYEFCDTTKHCDCAEDLSTWYENITSKCVLFEGSVCDDGPGGQACVSYAQCKKADGATDLTCACVDQFTRSVEGTCVGLYDAPCGPANKAECSADNFLECGGSDKCACSNSASSFYDGKECVLKAEADCNNDSLSQHCTEFSKCDGVSGEAGKCACEGGSEVSDEKTCITPYEGPCGAGKAECGKFQKCNVDSSTCLCEDPVNMIFDATHKKCVLKLNAGCTLNDPTSPECAEFSECQGQDPDAVCKCRLDLVETKDGACALSYDGICSKTDGPKCNDDAYLECNDNQKCACKNVDNSHFNTTSKSCELNVGAVCSQAPEDMQCPAMAGCVDVESELKCACDEGLIQSADTCVMSHDGFCDDANPNIPTCNGGVFEKCVGNKCGCNDDAGYNATSATCELLPGMPCVEGAGNQPCTEMTECKDKDGDGGFKCQCDEGLIESDKKCLTAYGGDCDDSNPNLPTCNTASYEFCDTNKHCACKEGFSGWYENITSKCALFEGSVCDDGPSGQACVSFAECKLVEGTAELKCACVDQFTRSVEGTCVGLYDAPCGPANEAQCSTDHFLECATGDKCACANSASSFYDGKQCVLKVEAACVNDPASQHCTEFSTCNGAPGATGTCACEGGSEVSDEKTCITPYGGACGDDKAECGKFQDCDVDSSTCLCEDPDNMIFDATHKKCVLKLNAGCKLNDPAAAECAEFSECKNPEGLCKCRADLTETKDGACALSYDGVCSKTDGPKCNADAYLECGADLKCACLNNGNSHFNATSKSCELNVGAVCSQAPEDMQCPAMAGCVDVESELKCACDEGLIQSADTCVMSHDGFCDDANPNIPTCNGGVFEKCVGNKCGCNDDAGYNATSATCELLPGMPCVEGAGNQPCTEMTECKDKDGDGGFKCQCDEGLIESDKKCLTAYGGDCDDSNPNLPTCNTASYEFCDTNKHCACKEGFSGWYENITSKCALFEGSVCDDGPSGQACVSFAECKLVEGTAELKCACVDQFARSVEGTCVGLYDAPCGPANEAQCSTDHFLECATGDKCACANSASSFYDGKQCVLKVEAACVNDPASQHCTEFSTCNGAPGATGTCACEGGSEVSDEKTCITPYGGACGDDKAECGKFQDCDVDSSTCLCEDPDNMIFDATHKKCVLKLNAGCKLNDPAAAECAEFSECKNPEGLCKCRADLTETKDGACALSYDGVCSKTDGPKCNADAYLECGADLKCACLNNGNSHFNATSKSCELNVGAVCSQAPEDMQCPAMAGCVDVESELKCACDEGLIQSADTCVMSHDGFCDDANPNIPTCNGGVFEKCVGNKCGCNDDAGYNATSATCELLPGMPCVEGAGNQPCTEMTECKDKDGDGGFKCQCDEGLIESDKKCLTAYGGDCDDSNPNLPTCNTASYEFCDTNKHCACKEGFSGWYENITSKCALFEGSVCDDGPSGQACVSFAECKLVEGTAELKCACVDQFTRSVEGTCVGLYDAPCGPANEAQCSTDHFLECATGDKCACANSASSFYDGKQCVLKVEAACVNDPASQHCTEFSTCNGAPGASGTCACEGGSEVSDEKTCITPYGGACGDDKAECGKFQDCDVDSSTCLCEDPDNMIFDATHKKCVLKLNAGCKLNDPAAAECAEFSECKNPEGLCKCRADLTETKDGACALSYDGVCSKTDGPKCNADAYLECGADLKCACLNNGNSHFNATSKSCELNVGAVCSQAPEDMQCPAMAGCVDVESELKCACDEGLIQSADTCVMSHDGFCDDANPNIPTCNGGVFEKCVGNKCGCNDDAGYNATSATCELLPGMPCVEGAGNQPCTEMTECKDKDGDGGFKCQCDEGLIESDKKCLTAYGGDCDDSNPNLPTCNTASYEFCDTNKHCACKEGFSGWYENITSKCALFEGSVCDDGPSGQACVSFAECKLVEGTAELKCACVDQFTRSVEGTCVGLYDAPCGPANEAQCSTDHFLECATGDSKCTCSNPANTLYDGTQCVLKAEAACVNDPLSQHCTEFSKCDGVSGAAGTCACEGGSEVSDEKTCITPYGGACGDDKAECGKFQDCNVDSSTCLCEDPKNMM